MIPKVIHYCWFGGRPLPELARKCIKSWEKYCPDYEIIQWDERNFDISRNRYVKQAYEAGQWAFVADYARLYVVYENGGIYLDTDVELLRGLDSLLEYNGFMGFEDERHIATGLGFGACKRNRLIFALLRDYDDLSFVRADGTFDLTPCPVRNTEVLLSKGLTSTNTKQLIDGVIFLPTDYLNPLDQYTGRLVITDRTYSIHHFMASWMSDIDKDFNALRREYSKIFGVHLAHILAKVIVTIKGSGYLGTLMKIAKRVTKF